MSLLAQTAVLQDTTGLNRGWQCLGEHVPDGVGCLLRVLKIMCVCDAGSEAWTVAGSAW